MISDRKADQKSLMRTKVRLFVFYYIAHASPQPFSNYTIAIIANHHPSQWFPVQSTHTSAAILFCDITKSSENVIADIVHWKSYHCTTVSVSYLTWLNGVSVLMVGRHSLMPGLGYATGCNIETSEVGSLLLNCMIQYTSVKVKVA